MNANEVLVWPFTRVGATTEPGMLSQPLLRRFLVQVELEPYTEAEITQSIIGKKISIASSVTRRRAVARIRGGHPIRPGARSHCTV
jgi:Holliday junction resolvasome RuvABC ATP-dependent DNA helicase subunit